VLTRVLALPAPSTTIMSSKLPSVLSPTEADIQMLLAAQCHIGTKNVDKQMLSYVWKRRVDGACARVAAAAAARTERARPQASTS
jgi:ribosomal protein S2